MLFCLSLSPATQAEPAPGLSPEAIRHIDTAVESWRGESKAPGLSIAVVSDNQLVWSKGYGLADMENGVPARSDTVYRLASLTKCLTAVAVMQLVEQGKMDLDLPIQNYYPSYPQKPGAVTPRQLLTHMAGVRHNKWRETTSTRHFASVAEAIDVFKDDPLLFEPGTKYSYSTQGYVLLGGAIENVSGITYLQYLQEHIFKPAGMTQTAADDTGLAIPNRAVGYRKGLFGFGWLRGVHLAPPHDTSIKLPAGGLVSTVEDMARFAVALNTGRLVRPDTLEKMWAKPKTRDGKESDYGLGFLLGEKDGRKRVFNDGNQAGTRTFLFLQPNEKFAVCLMTNLERAECEVLTPRIREVVLK
ncbi:MAG: beta-lactamase family protein [Verrucomicrobiota bacterium]|nr:beta-lactamase family protein [Verrucomicrobiota bacterium]